MAERTAQTLHDAGLPVRMQALDTVDAAMLARSKGCLFVASTTGEGDPPDHALTFVRDVMGNTRLPEGVSYAVLALGDRNYQHYCAFGHALDTWLRQEGATPLFDLIEVDNGDLGALRHWQHHLGVLAGAPELAEWTAASYDTWTLDTRDHINPGSQGGAVFALQLAPPPGAPVHWQAGDIAEVGPRNAPAAVTALLDALALDARAPVPGATDPAAAPVALGELLARSHLPTPEEASGLSASALAATLRPLPHREYSIASTPAEGSLKLLLRRMLRPDGTPGLGSGWLCDHVQPGASVDLRIRSNPNFHAPDPSRPMILIGNGTGIAGLRAHLAARAALGAPRNWLLFGERNAASDFFHGDDIRGWLASGMIERVDLAFSRDGNAHRYVQDVLLAQAPRLREWIDAGAAIYVCGSLQGMAPGVDRVLRDVLGDASVDALLASGRYRRDVY